MEAKTHEFEFEGKKYKFREMMVEELDDYQFPGQDEMDMKDVNNMKPFIKSQAKLLTKLSLDKTDFSKWMPFKFMDFIKESTRFIMGELLGVKLGELKTDLTHIPPVMELKK